MNGRMFSISLPASAFGTNAILSGPVTAPPPPAPPHATAASEPIVAAPVPTNARRDNAVTPVTPVRPVFLANGKLLPSLALPSAGSAVGGDGASLSAGL